MEDDLDGCDLTNPVLGTWPPLRLYEREQAALCTRMKALTAQNEKSNDWMNAARLFQVRRFFGSVKGFYTGTLDLSGRHIPRFEVLQTLWNSFLSDFCNLCANALPPSSVACDPDLDVLPTTCVANKINDSEWHDFKTKWRIPDGMTYSSLLVHTQSTVLVISKSPIPQIQKTTLIDLPTEIIELVMGHATLEQARLLSSTCRILRPMGLRIIFSHRSLFLRERLDWSDPKNKDGGSIRDAALAARAKLLDTADFLLSRADLLKSLRTLTIGDEWLNGTITELFDVYTIPEFYTPVDSALVSLLQEAENLRSLQIFRKNLTSALMQAISATLHTLNIGLCSLHSGLRADISDNHIKPLSGVFNLYVSQGGLDHFNDPCYILSLFPNILTLSLRGWSYTGNVDVAFGATIGFNPFATLERVCLDNFDWRAVGKLSRWIREASGSEVDPNLKLTHFKIHCQWGMDHASFIELMDVLRLAPNMRILALDGLMYGGVGIIDTIADACPHLEGLTLILRDSERQSRRALVEWPHPSYEYAARFHRFLQLRHFGWNIKVDVFRQTCTPQSMTSFEDGFSGYREEDDDFDDSHVVAGSFAAHCSSLRTFAIVERLALVVCDIERASNGGFQLLKRELFAQQLDMEQWDPSILRGCRWGPIEPSSR